MAGVEEAFWMEEEAALDEMAAVSQSVVYNEVRRMGHYTFSSSSRGHLCDLDIAI